MRRKIVAQGTSIPAQITFVKAKGLEMDAPELDTSSFRVRTISNSVEILLSRTCPDDCGPGYWNIARFPNNIIVLNDIQRRASMGGFVLGSGMDVDDDSLFHDNIGVVPGGPAEVPGH